MKTTDKDNRGDSMKTTDIDTSLIDTSNEAIEKWVSGIPEIDNMEGFDFCLRASLMEMRITAREYIAMETALQQFILAIDNANLSQNALSELREVLGYCL